MLTAERDQATCFQELLGRKREELDLRMNNLWVEVTRLDRVHHQRAIQSKRRIVRALEQEVHSIDRMLNTLRNRLLEQPLDGA